MKIRLSSDDMLNISQLFNEVCNGFNDKDLTVHSEKELIKTKELFDEIYNIVNLKKYKDQYEYNFDRLMITYKVLLENYIYYIVLEKDVLNSRSGVEDNELLDLMKRFEWFLKEARLLEQRAEYTEKDPNNHKDILNYLDSEIKRVRNMNNT